MHVYRSTTFYFTPPEYFFIFSSRFHKKTVPFSETVLTLLCNFYLKYSLLRRSMVSVAHS